MPCYEKIDVSEAVNVNSVIFVTIVNFQIKDLCFDRMSAIVVMICY